MKEMRGNQGEGIVAHLAVTNLEKVTKKIIRQNKSFFWKRIKSDYLCRPEREKRSGGNLGIRE